MIRKHIKKGKKNLLWSLWHLRVNRGINKYYQSKRFCPVVVAQVASVFYTLTTALLHDQSCTPFWSDSTNQNSLYRKSFPSSSPRNAYLLSRASFGEPYEVWWRHSKAGRHGIIPTSVSALNSSETNKDMAERAVLGEDPVVGDLRTRETVVAHRVAKCTEWPHQSFGAKPISE